MDQESPPHRDATLSPVRRGRGQDSKVAKFGNYLGVGDGEIAGPSIRCGGLPRRSGSQPEDDRHAGFNRCLGLMPGEFDATTHRHDYRANLPDCAGGVDRREAGHGDARS